MFEAIGEGHKIMAEGPKKEIDLNELERLAAQATPGPWVDSGLGLIRPPKKSSEFVAHCAPIVIHSVKKLQQCKDNAAYIVAACNAGSALIARVRELERQNSFFLKALKENFMCPYSLCKYDIGSDLDEWDCSSENNGECWIQAAKEAGE